MAEKRNFDVDSFERDVAWLVDAQLEIGVKKGAADDDSGEGLWDLADTRAFVVCSENQARANCRRRSDETNSRKSASRNKLL